MSTYYLFPGQIGIWKCWFLNKRENQCTGRKIEERREPTTNSTLNPTYGFDVGS